MSASLVGSEMCIRDRAAMATAMAWGAGAGAAPGGAAPLAGRPAAAAQAVSYTHLTLPTICSV
eukprot:3211838-Alexandrium_andersonii.AAC.1